VHVASSTKGRCSFDSERLDWAALKFKALSGEWELQRVDELRKPFVYCIGRGKTSREGKGSSQAKHYTAWPSPRTNQNRPSCQACSSHVYRVCCHSWCDDTTCKFRIKFDMPPADSRLLETGIEVCE